MKLIWVWRIIQLQALKDWKIEISRNLEILYIWPDQAPSPDFWFSGEIPSHFVPFPGSVLQVPGWLCVILQSLRTARVSHALCFFPPRLLSFFRLWWILKLGITRAWNRCSRTGSCRFGLIGRRRLSWTRGAGCWKTVPGRSLFLKLGVGGVKIC